MFEAHLAETFEGIPVIPSADFFLDYLVDSNALYQIWVEITKEEFICFPGMTTFETKATLYCIDYSNRAQLETVEDEFWFTVLDSTLDNQTPPYGELGAKLGELALKIHRSYSPNWADLTTSGLLSPNWSHYNQLEPEWHEANL